MPSWAAYSFAIALLVACAIGAGYGIAQQDGRIVTFAALLAGAPLLLMNYSMALAGALFSSLVVAGVVQLYAPGLQTIRWMIALFITTIGLYAVVTRLLSVQQRPGLRDDTGNIALPVIIFLVYAILNTAFQSDNTAIFVFGTKGYFQVWGLFFAFSLAAAPQATVEQFPRLLLLLALTQLPFAMHQLLFLVPLRVNYGDGVVAEDVVAGTFGASLFGGGAGAVMSILLIMTWAYVLALFRNRQLSIAAVSVLSVLLLTPILVNASRIAIVYILVAYVGIFLRDMLARPKLIFASTAMVSVVLAAVLWGNISLVSKSTEYDGLAGMVSFIIESNVDEDFGYGAFELNRVTSVTFWQQENLPNQLSFWIGHGMGASREPGGAALAVKTLASSSNYAGLGIGLTAVPAVLWELGVIGLGLLLWLLLRSYGTARKLAHRTADARESAGFEAMKVGIALFAISLFHKNFFVSHLPYQALLMGVLGYIAYYSSRLRRAPERR